MKTVLKLISFTIAFLVCVEAVIAYEIKVVGSVKLSQEKKIIAYVASLCVIEDELYLMSDMKLGHVKVFGNDGKLLNVLGRKGFGPEEFDRPYYSFYREKKYGVYDLSTWRVHIYERTNKSDFKRVKTVFCSTGISDVQINGNKLFIDGYVQDKEGKDYFAFSRDIELEKNDLLMPAYYKYAFSSNREYKAKRDLPETVVRGSLGFIEVACDSVYYAWEGDLSVVRINLSTRAITRFGHISPRYKKPVLSQEFIKAHETRYSNPSAFGAARFKMSYIHDLLACDAFVMVIFRGPQKDEKLPPYTAQFYTLDGTFINEIILPLEWEWQRFFLDKEKNVLYAVTKDGENDEEYYIVKMKISNGK